MQSTKKKRMNIANFSPLRIFLKIIIETLNRFLHPFRRPMSDQLTAPLTSTCVAWTVRPHTDMYITRCLVAYLLTLNMQHRALMAPLALVHCIFLYAHAPPSANISCLQPGCMDNIMSFPPDSDPLRITWPSLISAQPIESGTFLISISLNPWLLFKVLLCKYWHFTAVSGLTFFFTETERCDAKCTWSNLKCLHQTFASLYSTASFA